MAKNLAESREMAAFQAAMNQINQQGPWGSLMFSGSMMDTRFGQIRDPSQATATTTLSPEQQRLYDQQQVAQRLLGRQGIDLARALPGAGTAPIADQFRMPNFGPASSPGINNPLNLLNLMRGNTDFSAERDRVEGATFDRAMNLLNPQFDLQESRMQQRLANQGLPQASRAYTAETGRFADTRNQAMEQAAMAAVLAGGQEQSRLLSDLLGTSAAGVGQAMANRGQRFGEAVQGYGLNTNAALANRQIPFQEMLQLFGQQPAPFAGDFVAPSPTGLVNYGSQPGASGTNPAMGALGGVSAGAAAGAPFGPWGAGIGAGLGGLLGLFGSR